MALILSVAYLLSKFKGNRSEIMEIRIMLYGS